MAIDKFIGLTIKVTYPGDDDSSARNHANNVMDAITQLLRVVGQGNANVWTSTVKDTELEAATRIAGMLTEMAQ